MLEFQQRGAADQICKTCNYLSHDKNSFQNQRQVLISYYILNTYLLCMFIV